MALANLLGMLMFVAAGLPSALLTALMTGLVHRPALTPIVLLLWCGIALPVSRVLFGGVAVLFDHEGRIWRSCRLDQVQKVQRFRPFEPLEPSLHLQR